MKGIDITGQKYGRLTAIKISGKRGRERVWLCQCECGNQVEVTRGKLRSGHTRSCGCLFLDMMTQTRTTHGKSKTKFYHMYRTMITRCENPNHKNYADYGGRGISVCNEWRDSFEVFEKWSMGNGWKPGLTIDRIDNNGNYEPENCRWVNHHIQGLNKRNNCLITINGRTQTLQEWANETGINRTTIASRIHRSKWSGEDLIKPIMKG